MTSIIKISSVIILFAWASNAVADFYLITHNDVNIKTISGNELKTIFLGRKKLWDNGSSISPCYLSPLKSETNEFFKNVIKKDHSGFSRYWNKKLFSGSGSPPFEFDTMSDLLEYAKRNKGSICVVYTQPSNLPENIGYIDMK